MKLGKALENKLLLQGYAHLKIQSERLEELYENHFFIGKIKVRWAIVGYMDSNQSQALVLLWRPLIKIYYAHPMITYHTQKEAKTIQRIRENFKNIVLVNPRNFKFSDMESYLRVVKKCDVVVFEKLNGLVTAGVGSEVITALENEIPVFEISASGTLQRVEVFPRHKVMSREKTIEMYRMIKFQEGRSSENSMS